MAVALCLNFSEGDLNIFLTILESGMGYPRLKEQFTISLNSE